MREATQHRMAFRWHTIDLMGGLISPVSGSSTILLYVFLLILEPKVDSDVTYIAAQAVCSK
jgi:hypothetical protein